MTDKKVLVPGPDHPITLEATGARVTVTLGGRVIADTTDAITLREASYPPVQYIPLADVDPAVLRPSDHATYCPFKGDASYYVLQVGDDLVPAARVVLPRAARRGRADQGPRRVLPRPGRRDRGAPCRLSHAVTVGGGRDPLAAADPATVAASTTPRRRSRSTAPTTSRAG